MTGTAIRLRYKDGKSPDSVATVHFHSGLGAERLVLAVKSYQEFEACQAAAALCGDSGLGAYRWLLGEMGVHGALVEDDEDDIKDSASKAKAMRKAWDEVAEEAARQARAEGAIVTPLVNTILSKAREIAAAMDESFETLPLGDALDSVREQIKAWARTADTKELLQIADPNEIPRYLAEIICQETPLVGTTKGLASIMPILTSRLERVIANPNLTQETEDLVVEWALDKLVGMTQARQESQTAFWREWTKRGGRLNEKQRRRLWLIVQESKMERPMAPDTRSIVIASIRDSMEIPDVRDFLLEKAQGEGTWAIKTQMLYSSQGKMWATIAKDLNSMAEHPMFVRPVFRKCEEWNMEGVSREDLLFLVGNEDQGLRNEGLRLISVAKRLKEKNDIARKPTASPTRKR